MVVHFTEEHKKKLSIAHMGKPGGFLGKRHSPKTIQKMREHNARYWLGKHFSEETRKKLSDFQRGEKHYNWKGGITSVNNGFRSGRDYARWRKMCRERDNFTCQNCGQNGGEIIVHHLNNFSDFPELRLLLTNGVTLCKNCHKLFHHLYGNHNNTKEQFDAFVIRNE